MTCTYIYVSRWMTNIKQLRQCSDQNNNYIMVLSICSYTCNDIFHLNIFKQNECIVLNTN